MIAQLLRFALGQRFITLLVGLSLIFLGVWAYGFVTALRRRKNSDASIN